MLKKKKILLCCAVYFLARKNRSRAKYHIHPINKLRKTHGEYYTLIKNLELYPQKFYQYFRMNQAQFNYILSKINKMITPKVYSFRKDAISAKEKLVITLRFLASGASFTDLALRFHMGITTVRRCIIQTIRAINFELKSTLLPKPTQSGWEKISREFYRRWNFPNCLGAVDGKHIKMFCPGNSGSLYFNYKKTFSIGLIAVVDAQYKFVMVNIGSYGSNSDAAVFANSRFGEAWINNSRALNIPNESHLPGTSSRLLPQVLVGDEAFGLKPNLLTPYPGVRLSVKQRLFNYRLSRARRIVENAFGILSHTWRILLKSLEIQVPLAKELVLCCSILHNFLRTNLDEIEIISEEDIPYAVVTDLNAEVQIRPASYAHDVREIFADWCLKEGDIPFQHGMI